VNRGQDLADPAITLAAEGDAVAAGQGLLDPIAFRDIAHGNEAPSSGAAPPSREILARG
jgi:hypothetical protein